MERVSVLRPEALKQWWLPVDHLGDTVGGKNNMILWATIPKWPQSIQTTSGDHVVNPLIRGTDLPPGEQMRHSPPTFSLPPTSATLSTLSGIPFLSERTIDTFHQLLPYHMSSIIVILLWPSNLLQCCRARSRVKASGGEARAGMIHYT